MTSSTTQKEQVIDLTHTGTPSPKKDPQGKLWCVTIHYQAFAIATTLEREQTEAKKLKYDVALHFLEQIGGNASYAIFGRETCPKTGSHHFQGYVEFKKRQRLSTLKKAFHKSFHWEPAKGTLQQNIDYCSKEDDNPITFGTLPEPVDNGERERNRWKKARLAAVKGDFDEIDDQIFIQNYKNVVAIRNASICDTEWLKEMPGIWLYGVSGSGKTYKARTGYPGRVYLKQLNKWWCGYAGEENVVIEDIDQSHAFLLYYIKIWIDVYPFAAEVKNGSVKQIRPKRIIITSNHSIKDIFKVSETLSEEDQLAVQRRFQVEYFPFAHPDVKARIESIKQQDPPEDIQVNFNAPIPQTPANPANSVFKKEDYETPQTIDKSELTPVIGFAHERDDQTTQPMTDDEEEAGE